MAEENIAMLTRLLEGFPFGAIVVSRDMVVSAVNSHVFTATRSTRSGTSLSSDRFQSSPRGFSS